MAFGLTMGTERATALQNAIQEELIKRNYSAEADPVMAEYITIMVINNKSSVQITSELEDLIGSDFDASFVDWLFAEASKGAPATEAPPAPEASTSSAPPARDSPDLLPHQQVDNRRPPNGPRAGSLPSHTFHFSFWPETSASARSPSPQGHPPSKARRTDHLPTGPRAMQRGDRGEHGQRSLLDRMGPRGHGPQFNPHDDVQARIDSITNGPVDPSMMMMNGFPMNGMPGMDMGAMSMANPMMLQELMMSQMAMMSQIAGAMGIMNPANGQFMGPNGFPMQPGMGDMNGFNGNGMNGGIGPSGNERGRGEEGVVHSWCGRGRGGHHGQPNNSENISSAEATPAPNGSHPPRLHHKQSLRPQSQRRHHHPLHFDWLRSPWLRCPRTSAITHTLQVCYEVHKSALPILSSLPYRYAESGIVLSTDACEKGKACKDKDCIKSHVSPAVINPNAEPPKPLAFTPPVAAPHPKMLFLAGTVQLAHAQVHPEGRVLPGQFHRGLATAPGTGADSPHKTVTFKRPDGTPTSAAELEKQVKEMEARKNEAEKAIAQAQNGKKEEGAPAVPISA
ncbi:uncharacterized protein BXZ73DRAFT_74493 [Epithele typhae]|uniref:uncharacterized protein n=1 Tax=Epithele typhae TaxID=378194 RepID=UPI002007DC13|nr:uncharacterized protein BXZ73DRAFT_74493 [Epithele typhae]KAH9942191.1 hypothetical protein BXZ73DRAFT_74493 [Epithele typhae]